MFTQNSTVDVELIASKSTIPNFTESDLKLHWRNERVLSFAFFGTTHEILAFGQQEVAKLYLG